MMDSLRQLDDSRGNDILDASLGCNKIHISRRAITFSLSLSLSPSSIHGSQRIKKLNSKVQEELQADAAANPRHQEEEKKCHRLKCS